jgi:hypothetical protein
MMISFINQGMNELNNEFPDLIRFDFHIKVDLNRGTAYIKEVRSLRFSFEK